MTKLQGSRLVYAGERLFPTLEYIAIFSDLFGCGYFVAGQKSVPPKPGDAIGFDSNIFPVQFRLAPFGLFRIALWGGDVGGIEFRIDPKFPGPPIDIDEALRIKAVNELFFNAALVVFYERHRPWINSTYGSNSADREKWPEILRFAWALRNAAAHHGGALNITDKSVRAVEWHHLKFDHTHTGYKVLGGLAGGDAALSIGDVAIFLVEMSDELDRLGCPVA
jgi:hypothetical protein